MHINISPPKENWFEPTLKHRYCSSALISTQGTYKSDAVTFPIMIVNYKIDLDVHSCTTFNLFFFPLAQHICIHKKPTLGEFSATSLPIVLQYIVLYYRHLHTTEITAKFTIFFSSWFSLLINDKKHHWTTKISNNSTRWWCYKWYHHMILCIYFSLIQNNKKKINE